MSSPECQQQSIIRSLERTGYIIGASESDVYGRAYPVYDSNTSDRVGVVRVDPYGAWLDTRVQTGETR